MTYLIFQLQLVYSQIAGKLLELSQFSKVVTNDRSNYIPSSVLPFVSMLFEKLIYNQFYGYPGRNKFLFSKQPGLA